MIRILITGCGGFFMVDTIRAYKEGLGSEVFIAGCSSEPDNSVIRELNYYERVPRCDDPDYFPALFDMCERIKPDVLIPTIDDELEILSANSGDFLQIGTVVSVSDYQSIKNASNKLRFLENLEKHNIPHPKYACIRSVNDLENALPMFGYPKKPVCLKAANKEGSRGFRIIDQSRSQFDIFMNEKPTSEIISVQTAKEIIGCRDVQKLILQEYIRGDEYSIDALCDHGKIISMVGRRNIKQLNSIPLKSTVETNSAAFEVAEKVCGVCDLDGNVGIDFIFNQRQYPIPIECNTRITATISLTAAAGVNLAAMQVKRLLGIPFEVSAPKEGVTINREYVTTFNKVM